MDRELLISVDNISKKFGPLAAVEGVSFDVYSGEICGVAGLNGAGKSTLLSILAGVMRPDGGAVYYRGRPVYTTARYDGGGARPETPPRAKMARTLRIGYVPQEIALFPDLTVYDNLKFWSLAGSKANAPQKAGTGKATTKERLTSVAEATGLYDRLRQPLHSLSGGMKQRVNIAAALVTNPDILIMDEPTAGLDVKNRRDIINIINALVKRAGGGLAVICTSHQSGELEMISNRLLLLDRGMAVYNGPPSGVFSGQYAAYDNIDDILYSLSGGGVISK